MTDRWIGTMSPGGPAPPAWSGTQSARIHASYAAAVGHFGESGIVELVTIIGYYCLISLTPNTFDVQLTERMTDAFPD